MRVATGVGAAMPRVRSKAGRSLSRLLAAGVLALLTASCGISLRAETTASEIFEELTVAGDFTVGEQLSFTLAYEQPYPVTVRVVCDLLELQTNDEEPEELSRILIEDLPPNPDGGPLDEATPVAGEIQRSFAGPDSPGRYLVLCATDEDEDNAIAEEFTITASTPGP